MNWFLIEYYTPGGMEIRFAYVRALDSLEAKRKAKERSPDFNIVITCSQVTHVEPLAGCNAYVIGHYH